MARIKTARLPNRLPLGSVYVVEARGSAQGMTLMHRYVRFPDGRQVELAARLVPACGKSRVTVAKTSRDSATRPGGRTQAAVARAG